MYRVFKIYLMTRIFFYFYNIKIRKIRDKNRYFIYGCIYGSYKFKVCADVVCV